MATTRVIVTGDRNWNCRELAARMVSRLAAKYNTYGDNLVVVHGSAPGVDAAFANACREAGVFQEPHPAQWGRFGKAAGPRRNAEMVAAGAILCIAVHADLANSRGTLDCVRQARRAGIPALLIDSDPEQPRWINSVG